LKLGKLGTVDSPASENISLDPITGVGVLTEDTSSCPGREGSGHFGGGVLGAINLFAKDPGGAIPW
jgi:hypothetical protein